MAVLSQDFVRYTEVMRLGIISYDFDPPIGGLGIVAKQYVQELRRLHPSDAFVSISPSSKATERVSWLVSSRHSKSGGCPLFSLFLLFLLPSLIRRHSLDLLHVHAGSGGVFLLRKPSVPLVVTAHHTYRQEVDLVFRRHPLRRAWKFLMSLLEKRTYRIADAITCVSKDTADALVCDYGVDPSTITVIENGVADQYFSQPTLTRDACRILFVGRLEDRKGIWVLLDAFRTVLAQVPESRLELIGRNLIGPSLLQYIRSHDLSSAVDLRGYIDEKERVHSMSTATIVVIPSLLEGFGLICAEAMALACPIVCSSAPGLRSLIQHDVTGVIVDPCDSQHLSDALLRLLRDSTLQRTLASSAQVSAVSRFRWSRAGESLERTLNAQLKNK